nr:EAL domain-containing protein [Sphingobium nicotianae]
MAQAQKTALVGAIELDVARDKILCTPEIFEIFGVDPATFEPSAGTLVSRVSPDDQDVVRALIADYIETGASKDFDCRLKMDDGAIKHVHVNTRAALDARNRPKRLMAIIQDVTERTTNEMERSALAAIVDCSRDAIVSETATGVITSWNPGAERLFGYDAREVLGKNIRMIIPESRHEELRRNLLALQRGDNIEPFDSVRRHKDGRLIPVSMSVSINRDGAGKVIGVSFIARDITERQVASEALAYRDRLLHAVTLGTGILVKAGSLDQAMPESLSLVGKSLGVDRVVVMQDRPAEGQAPIVRDVWQAEDVEARLNAVALLGQPVEDPIMNAWIAPLRDHQSVATQLSSSEGHVRAFLERLQIQSSLIVPIFVGETFWGALAVDSCRCVRAWTKTEIDMLNIFGDIVGSVMVHEASSRSLEQSEARFRAVTTAAQDAIIVVDGSGKIDFWNSSAERILGYSAAEALGREVHDLLVPPKFREDAARGMETFGATGQGRLVGRTTEFSALRKDGVEIAVEISLAGAKLDERTSAIGILRDITERKRAEEKLQFANLLLKTQMEASLDGILIVDAQARIISFNQRFIEIWNVPQADLLAGDDNVILAKVQSSVKESSRFIERVRYLYDHPDEDGYDDLETVDQRSLERYTVALKAPSGEYLGRAWFFRDITERKRAAEIAHRSAREDILTGLANRAVFVEDLEHAIASAKRGVSSFAVIYLDLDHFKDVNDTLGHPIGDQLLKAVAGVLRSHTRETDTVARFGGDEFAIIVADIRDPTDAAILADKLIDALSAPFIVQGHEVHSGASLGIAMFGADAPDAETLLSYADVALYRAKSDGRGGYRFFTDEMDREVQLRVKLGFELREAIDAGDLFLLYQPQVALGSGQITGVEALVRWRHPVRGVLGPDLFIPIAERIGVIAKLGNWVLWTACRQAKIWLDMGLPPVRMAVNVSALQFKTPVALEDEITKILSKTGLPPQSLELELTETVLMEVTREHSDVLSRLRAAGITTAIDDFGTGYSSLNYLIRFPSNRVKIAQNFVADLESIPENAAIIKATIGLARELEMNVIAEGVETEVQAKMLKKWGCQEVQGYLFARPLSVEDTTAILKVGKICALSKVTKLGDA